MIAKLGEAGFKKYKQGSCIVYCENIFCLCKTLCNTFATDLFANGKNFHECVAEHLLLGSDVSDLPLNEDNRGLWMSVSPLLEHVSDVRLAEKFVEHPLLAYKGVVDCVARFRYSLLLPLMANTQCVNVVYNIF